ncbi:MAG TPA: PIG-L family deacetylase [Ignavibacteria bacterium]|nr:PIG-L family deacetylase [Ignavibacteria bacterium]HMR00148.1 PIG-L family deacetylase [Ignavibacteria bacterium]
MKKFILALLLLFPVSILSQEPSFTILCIAAHPDDEDGAALAYYSYLYGYDAYTVFYTRGEGGQNEIGPELNDKLGRLREQECYDAAKIQGTKAYFLGELDFGFSKTAKETFKIWGGEDSVLARIVYMIRVLRPDVVITNHDTITTKPDRQHGNHQACGITIFEAFDKAADYRYHPEQLVNGIEPWQLKKLFFRSFDSTKADLYKIDISKTISDGKTTIAEISRDALFQHKTQGMDKVSKDSPFFFGNRFYQLVRSDRMYPLEGDDLFSGLEHNMKWNTNDLKSYETMYSYRTVSAEDSLKILNEVKVAPYRRIGLVKTYDNTIENILKAFNVQYDTLSPLAVEVWDLNRYSTIILDIRAYLNRPDVVKFNKRFLKYAEGGGNLLVFYNKPQDWNEKGDLAPYPIYISSERVTEEDAEVKVLVPNHTFFNNPNVINDSDWTGWIQERNIYLPSDRPGTNIKTSSEYQRLLAMQDDDDPVPSTSLLYAGYKYGTYTYCSLALYRQLKIFHKGALKLFMNMISQKTSNERSIDNIR